MGVVIKLLALLLSGSDDSKKKCLNGKACRIWGEIRRTRESNVSLNVEKINKKKKRQKITS